MPDVEVHAPDGTLGTVPQEDLKAALAQGYTLPHATVTQAPVGASPVSAEGMRTTPEELPEPDVGEKPASAGFSIPVMLRNRETGKAEPVEPSQVPQALLAGTHEVADPKADVQVTASDGTLGTVPGEDLAEALKSGDFHLPTDKELADAGIRTAAKENLGAGTAALLGLGAPMQGVVEAAGKRLGLLPEDLSGAHTAEETVKEEHPAAYWGSRVAGELAGAYALGGAGEGASASLKLSGYAKAAVEGAIYSAPEVAEHILDKDPAGAAEALAFGVAGNVGLHGVFSAVGKLRAPKVVEALAGDAREEEVRVAENTVGKAFGVPPAQVAKLRQHIEPLIDAAGITEKDSASSALKKIRDLGESGPKIGKAITALNEAESKSTVITEALSKANTELRELVEKTAEGGGMRRQTEGALKDITDELSAVARKPDLSFDDTQTLKRFVGEQTNFTDNKLVNSVRRDAYSIVRKNIMDAENAAADEIGGSAVVEGLKADRASYALDMMFGKFAERAEAKDVMESPLGHTHLRRHGVFGMLAHAVFGHVAAPIAVGLSVGELALRAGLKKNTFGKAVRAIKGSAAPNTSLALDAVKAMDDHVSTQVKNLFSALATRAVVSQTDAVSGTIAKLLPNSGSGQSHATQIRVLKRAAAQYRENPGGVADHLAEMTAPMRQEGMGKVADAYTEHQLRLMKVIDAILPEDPAMTKAHPFAAQVAPEDISPATKSRVDRLATIATDPTALLGLVKSNSISPTDVAIAAATNPSALAKLRSALVNEAMERKPDLTYQHRISMAIMMGTYMDESSRQLPVLQGAFAAPMPSGTTDTPKPIKTDDKKMDEQASAFLPDSAKGVVSAR